MNSSDGIALTPEYSSALNEYELLRESLLNNEEKREYLLHQALPELQSIYLMKVGKLKLELLEIRIEVYRLKRKMELIQSCVNKQSDVVIEAINLLLEEEIKDQRKKLETESKKLEEAIRFNGIPPMSNDESSALKKLYYKLAQLLHPDINPGQSDTMKTLWLKVSECYRLGDLNQLRLLEVLIANETMPDATPTALEELKRRNTLFSSRISQLMKEIEHVITNFPFTFSEQLKDPSWIEAVNNESLNSISKAMEEKQVYENVIEVLLSGADS